VLPAPALREPLARSTPPALTGSSAVSIKSPGTSQAPALSHSAPNYVLNASPQYNVDEFKQSYEGTGTKPPPSSLSRKHLLPVRYGPWAVSPATPTQGLVCKPRWPQATHCFIKPELHVDFFKQLGKLMLRSGHNLLSLMLT